MKNLKLIVSLALLTLISACGSDDDPGDTQSPTTPSNLIASNVTQTSLQLDWEISTDNVAVSGYRIYEELSGSITEVGNSTTTYFIDNLLPETAFRYYVTAVDAAGNESGQSNSVEVTTEMAPLEYLTNLSEMGVYTNTLADLVPADGVQLFELSSILFTDYASKQRLIRLPNGQAMRYDNSDFLPIFPDNTLIAKTFYYYLDEQNPNLGKQIIETRLLIKIEGEWVLGNYVWNASQTEATYSEDASEIPISYIDSDGGTRSVDYIIPSMENCITCHNNEQVVIPIGPKLRTMNFVPSYTDLNQLEYFIANDLLDGLADTGNIGVLPDWTDEETYSLTQRSRAYLDINCAHCHQPGGEVTNFDIDFRYETPYNDTGIYANRGDIEERIQSVNPVYMMPRLGRTVVHEEAVAMLLEYLDQL